MSTKGEGQGGFLCECMSGVGAGLYREGSLGWSFYSPGRRWGGSLGCQGPGLPEMQNAEKPKRSGLGQLRPGFRLLGLCVGGRIPRPS